MFLVLDSSFWMVAGVIVRIVLRFKRIDIGGVCVGFVFVRVRLVRGREAYA